MTDCDPPAAGAEPGAQARPGFDSFLRRAEGVTLAARLLADHHAPERPLTVFWLNLDRFRQVNESFGHAGGDRMIEAIAARVRAVAGERSALVRMGSDEFAVLTTALPPDAAEPTARRLLGEVELPLAIGDIQIRPSASLGVAISGADECAARLMERADRAMLDAKRHGGSRFVVSAPDDLPGRPRVALARRELLIESALRSAMEVGEMALHYQPIVRADGSLDAVEALMRCTTPGVRMPPDEFIPVAEATGLIARLGEWSLLQGAHFAARLRDHGVATRVAINVSRAQLLSQGFLPALHAALHGAGVAPELIELEITESLFMEHSAVVQANLQSIRQAGVGLAIDDFGTGYSCLSTLKDLPATKLKFDRAFIHVLPGDRRALAIVKSMAQLARELDIQVVAEGVESHEQRVACEVAGVHATQGYLHARPMPQDDLLAWIDARR